MPTTITHPGLIWRFDADIIDAAKDTYREDHINQTCALAAQARNGATAHGRPYRLAFSRRKAWLESPARAACDTLTIAGRLETGIGEPGVFESQVALHPVTGMPRLVGSGLKGLLAAWCHERYDRLARQDAAAAGAGMPRSTLQALFGSRPGVKPTQAGRLVVHDAWWDPDSPRGPLEMERNTPHHVAHNTGEPGAQATDFDSPNPVPRIAIAGSMHFAIDHDGVGPDWAALCLHWLHLALAEQGAGAARSLGYGRFL